MNEDFLKVYSSKGIDSYFKCLNKCNELVNNNVNPFKFDNYYILINDLEKELKINTALALRLLIILLTKATENGLTDRVVKISTSEYMKLVDIKSFEKDEIIKELRLLMGLSYQDENDKKIGFINAFESVYCSKDNEEYERGYIKVKFTEGFYKLLNNKTFFYYHKKLLQLKQKKNTHSFELGLFIYYYKRVNLKNNRDVISIKTLLNRCSQFNYESIKKLGQLTEKIRKPFERDLNKLSELGIIWEYVDKVPTTYDEFIKSKIKITFTNYPTNKSEK